MPTKNNIRIEIINSEYSSVLQVDERESRTEKARVLEIGEDVERVKVGDVVLFKTYNLDEIIIDNETYVLIPEDDVKYVVAK